MPENEKQLSRVPQGHRDTIEKILTSEDFNLIRNVLESEGKDIEDLKRIINIHGGGVNTTSPKVFDFFEAYSKVELETPTAKIRLDNNFDEKQTFSEICRQVFGSGFEAQKNLPRFLKKKIQEEKFNLMIEIAEDFNSEICLLFFDTFVRSLNNHSGLKLAVLDNRSEREFIRNAG